jgi:hypothetical protein
LKNFTKVSVSEGGKDSVYVIISNKVHVKAVIGVLSKVVVVVTGALFLPLSDEGEVGLFDTVIVMMVE